jgi:hypothetical protein
MPNLSLSERADNLLLKEKERRHALAQEIIVALELAAGDLRNSVLKTNDQTTIIVAQANIVMEQVEMLKKLFPPK